eukprot:TRINITY_DN28589_c0_g2_i1.p1 TRINITY_DN28589_c0_g2~~TRINITY_DN28589_c0_g2_i1.p1  ORF type:complete len:272 (+),score=72.12 TRINITY_DN28589_c0_g2_i1:117-932(+)
MVLTYFSRGLGFACREAAYQFDKVGCILLGSNTHHERVVSWKRLTPFHGKSPHVDTTCFLAPNVNVIGSAQLGSKVGVFYQTVIRADTRDIVIGSNTTVQDRCVIRTSPNYDVQIGSHVTIEPSVVVTGASIGDDVFIGAGSTIMEGARIEAQSILAPGSVVQKFAVVPSGELWAGTPAEKVRNLTEEEVTSLRTSALHGVGLAEVHKDATEKSFETIQEERQVMEQWASLESCREPIRAAYGQYEAGPSGSGAHLNVPGQLVSGGGQKIM